jgi:hypothetical protein
MQAWLQHPQPPLTLDHYLAADDIVFTYHLQRWQHHRDHLLSDLCQRFLDRKLLKGRDVSGLADSDRAELLAKTRAQVAAADYAPEVYCGLVQSQSRGYTLYQRGIKIWVDGQPVDIKRLSPIVEPLTHTYQRTWLLHPVEVTPWLDEQLQQRAIASA